MCATVRHCRTARLNRGKRQTNATQGDRRLSSCRRSVVFLQQSSACPSSHARPKVIALKVTEMDMRPWAMVGVSIMGSAILFAPPGVAAKQTEAGPPPPQVNALLACQSVTDSAERLACYDKAAAGISEAVARKDIVVYDRESVRKTKRGLFGFSIPNLGIFGEDDDEVEIKQVDGAIASTISIQSAKDQRLSFTGESLVV